MWLLPSRGRPNSIARFFKAWRDTEASTKGVLCLDEDDAPNYKQVLAEIELPETWRVSIRPRYKSLGDLTNTYFWADQYEPFYGLLADDAVPVTKHWDRKLVDAAGLDGIACCRDGISNGTNLGSAACIGGDFARSLGWIILPGLQRLYGDNVLWEIASARKVLRYLPDVVVEHWHFSTGKSPMDETYRKTCAEADRAIYEKWKGTR